VIYTHCKTGERVNLIRQESDHRVPWARVFISRDVESETRVLDMATFLAQYEHTPR
jgi:hypothetical protein